MLIQPFRSLLANFRINYTLGRNQLEAGYTAREWLELVGFALRIAVSLSVPRGVQKWRHEFQLYKSHVVLHFVRGPVHDAEPGSEHDQLVARVKLARKRVTVEVIDPEYGEEVKALFSKPAFRFKGTSRLDMGEWIQPWDPGILEVIKEDLIRFPDGSGSQLTSQIVEDSHWFGIDTKLARMSPASVWRSVFARRKTRA
ncbi:MAG: hypothetical protein ACYDBJ_27435 [Aggregatilineales bacterium]